jgi:hypothetical protein
LAQRLGRIERQGNGNAEVEVFRYITPGTFDAYLFQLVENKQKFISQIMTTKTKRLDELNVLLSLDERDDSMLDGEPDEGDSPPKQRDKGFER